jgi:ribonucleoside-diphosphate reductase alpha chain
MSNIYWLNKESRNFLSKGYLKDGQTPEQRIRQIADEAQRILKIDGFADKFESYMHKGYFSLSSPIWSNFGNNRGLSISCNGSVVYDSLDSIIYKTAETGMLTKHGAGTSAFLGKIRGRGEPISTGGVASGPVHYLELFNTITNVVSQSNVRRGSFAAYLNIDHPDILEFLGIREIGHVIQDISLGVTVPDYWMKEMIDGDKEKRQIWSKVIKKRFESGYPYIFFSDNVNNNAPDVYKDKGLKIHASNLCSEIALSSSDSETFVCNLSSLNILHYDEWKDTDAVKILTYFLDAVMSDYIEKTKEIPFLAHAHNFAKNQRALGVGTLGWHSYLQSKMIAFESFQAKQLNVKIHKFIQQQSLEASKEMAVKYGEPELLKGYGRRNVTLMAIAPTTSSSFILGQVSPSVEPLFANIFIKDLAKSKTTYKNPYLKKILEEKGKDNNETWDDILVRGGSVQHLTFLTDHEKEVFKTFGEISQKEILIQAVGRGKYIDQAQSINLVIHPKTPAKEVNELLIFAWENKLKTLYYQRGTSEAQELGRNLLQCKSCEA